MTSRPANSVVVVETVRPADGMKTVFHYHSFTQVYGDGDRESARWPGWNQYH